MIMFIAFVANYFGPLIRFIVFETNYFEPHVSLQVVIICNSVARLGFKFYINQSSCSNIRKFLGVKYGTYIPCVLPIC